MGTNGGDAFGEVEISVAFEGSGSANVECERVESCVPRPNRCALPGDKPRPAAGPVCAAVGFANASSAKTSVTLLLKGSLKLELGASTAPVDVNWKLAPLSCRMENSSKEGYLADRSSTAADRTLKSFESRAANGSMPEGFCVCSAGTAFGRPRRIGITSGMKTCGVSTGATFCRPTTGASDASSRGGGSLAYPRVSEGDLVL